MAKYLLNYRPDVFQSLNSRGTTWILTVQKTYFFGYLKNEIEIPFIIPHVSSAIPYFDHWDKMIKNKTKFRS